MSSRKFYDNLLIIAGIFIVFFVLTMITAPLLSGLFGLSSDSREGMLFLSVYQAVIMFIFPSIVSAKCVSSHPLSFLMLDKFPGALPFIGVVFAYLIALPALNQIIYWNENITFPESVASLGETLKELEDNANAAASIMVNVKGLLPMIVNLIVIGLITAFAEEMFFRGTLQNASASSGAPHTAIWIVAFFFSALHFQIFGFIPRLILGAWFGYLIFWTRSLFIPVFAHFLNNGVVVVCSWLSARGVSFDFERFGVSETGFPLAAFISAVAFVVFLTFFKNMFFKSSSYVDDDCSDLQPQKF